MYRVRKESKRIDQRFRQGKKRESAGMDSYKNTDGKPQGKAEKLFYAVFGKQKLPEQIDHSKCQIKSQVGLINSKAECTQKRGRKKDAQTALEACCRNSDNQGCSDTHAEHGQKETVCEIQIRHRGGYSREGRDHASDEDQGNVFFDIEQDADADCRKRQVQQRQHTVDPWKIIIGAE